MRKKKENNPYPSLLALLQKMDFVEEIFPEAEVNIELLPVTPEEIKGVAEPFSGTGLGDTMEQIREVLIELQGRRYLWEEDIIKLYLAREVSVFLCSREKSSLEEADIPAWKQYCILKTESVKTARWMAEEACAAATSYRRKMKGTRLVSQTELFLSALGMQM